MTQILSNESNKVQKLTIKLTKKATLLLDDNVKRWYDNVARGSPISADVSQRRLSYFCDLNKITPRELVELPIKSIQDMIMDTITELEKKSKAPDYIQGIVKAVKSWLRYNDIELKHKIKIRDAGVPVTLAKERVPKQSELEEILAVGGIRVKVGIALIAFSGLRLETLGNYHGIDGLRLGDFLDLVLDEENLHFTTIPAKVIVRRELSKAGHHYCSFLNQKGCNYIIQYLRVRRNQGEKLTVDSALIKASERKKDSSFVITANISDEIRRTIRKAGFKWRPYVLRAYFDTQLLIAENNGAISKDFRVFFMGHVGDIERRYTLGKGILPDELIDEMRLGYNRASEYLTQTKAEMTAKDAAKETELNILTRMGRLFDLDIEGTKKSLTEELGRSPTVDELLAEAYNTMESIKLSVEASKAAEKKDDPQLLIQENELPKYLTDGWIFQAQLKSGQIVIRK